MKKLTAVVSGTFVGLSLLAFSAAAEAGTIQVATCTQSAGTCATAIKGLNIGGTLYDVTFVQGTYDSIYPSAPRFLGDQAGATSAAQAILDALSATTLDGIVAGYPGPGRPNDVPNWVPMDWFLVPFAVEPTGEVSVMFGYHNVGSPEADLGWGPRTGVDVCDPNCGIARNFNFAPGLQEHGLTWNWTIITEAPVPTAVPEPATWLLLGTGIVALVTRRWLRKRT